MPRSGRTGGTPVPASLSEAMTAVDFTLSNSAISTELRQSVSTKIDDKVGNESFGTTSMYVIKRMEVIDLSSTRLSTPFHKYGHVCGEGFLAQTRREVLPHGHQHIPFSGL